MPDFSKLAATVFLLAVGISAIIIAVWDLLHGISMPEVVQTVLSVGVSSALYTLGINHGAQISINSTPAPTEVTK